MHMQLGFQNEMKHFNWDENWNDASLGLGVLLPKLFHPIVYESMGYER